MEYPTIELESKKYEYLVHLYDTPNFHRYPRLTIEELQEKLLTEIVREVEDMQERNSHLDLSRFRGGLLLSNRPLFLLN